MRYSVAVSDDALTKARQYYPPGGSADGTPSFDLFCDTILKAAKIRFAFGFDDLPMESGITALRALITYTTPFFPATVFYAVLDSTGLVTIVDFEPDEDYFSMIESDPTD